MPTSPKLKDYSPITFITLRLFELLKWLSVMKWLAVSGRCWPKSKLGLFRPRSELLQAEVNSDEFTRRRARAIESYLGLWLLLEIAVCVVVCVFPIAEAMAVLITAFASIRILEIVQVTVNATLFDALSGRPDGKVASSTRMFVLAGLNYLELCLCFGVIYATYHHELAGAGQPLTAFYFSAITQLTVGYGDVYATGWLRIVSALHGAVGVLFVILIFGRFVASLPRITSVFDGK